MTAAADDLQTTPLTSNELEEVANHDSVLASYIDVTERLLAQNEADGKPTEGGLSLTLLVNGAIVTGTLTSGEKWRAANDALFEEAFGPDEDDDEDDGPAPGAVSQVEHWERRHIHLVDAQIGFGNQLMPTGRGIPWRGRLRHVSGWSFGKMSVTRADAE